MTAIHGTEARAQIATIAAVQARYPVRGDDDSTEPPEPFWPSEEDGDMDAGNAQGVADHEAALRAVEAAGYIRGYGKGCETTLGLVAADVALALATPAEGEAP